MSSPAESSPAESRPAAEWTIRALMEWTEKHFLQRGIESPRLEAQLLLAHALGCKKTELYTRWNEPIIEEKRTRFRELIKRRLDGCPVQYLLGEREFFLLMLDVTPAVLIPRPETEVLVTEALALLKALPTARVLDIGTGSGAIALALAHRAKAALVTAIDISADALEVAKRNAVKHGLAERVRFLQGDLLAPVAGESFEIIVSNPPYVTSAEFAALPPHVRDFEPRLALEAGPDGFAIYDRLIPSAALQLVPGGTLLLEIGSTQEEGVRERLVAAGLEVGATIRDGRHPRVMSGRRAR